MFHVFHKSKYSDGAVLNLITNSKNFDTFLFSDIEAKEFITLSNGNAISKNLSIRYSKVKAVLAQDAA